MADDHVDGIPDPPILQGATGVCESTMQMQAITIQDTERFSITMAQAQAKAWDEEETGGVLNLEDVDENAGFEPLPPGSYPFQVDQATYGNSQSSGNPMITLRLSVDGAEEPEYNGRKLFYHLTLVDFGIQRLKKAIMALAPETDLRNFKPTECEDVFMGTRGIAKVAIRTYQGRRMNNVRDVLPDQQGGFFSA